MFRTLQSLYERWRMSGRVRVLKAFDVPGREGIGLRLRLGDRNPEVAAALFAAFADVPDVEAVEGDLLALDADAILSPANSFGDMGGGIDKAIDDFHRGAAQTAVMERIAQEWYGELPVGAAFVATLPGRRFTHVVAAPTMRIPGNVAGTIHAYLAMRGALVAVLNFNRTAQPPIRLLAVPGLCTGVGGMPAEQAAEQMRTAYDSVLGGGWRKAVHAALAPYPLAEP